MSKVTYNFKGLMAPVFTSFNNDKNLSVNYDNIDDYGKFLHDNNVNGVLVNGTSGEGMCLTVSERKKTAELWQKTCKKYNLSLMLQIGGAPIADVFELAAHAEKIKVDSILCLPELYFKPKTEEDLVLYFEKISKYCPTIPLLYYHIPSLTGVNLNLPRFLDLAEKKISTFVGLKFTSGDLEIGSACLREGRSVFLGSDTILCAALALGFDSSIMTTLNICPDLSLKIFDLMKKNQLSEAREVQRQLTKRVNEILKKGDWVVDMKREFNETNKKLNAGNVRKPELGIKNIL